MVPVTTTLLATLLPICFLIFGLSILSIYLFLKLRASGAKEGLELRAQPTTPKQLPEPELEPAKLKGAFPQPEPLSSFSDASNPDWENDFRHVFENLSAWPLYSEFNEMFTSSRDQIRAKRILDEVGYEGVPVPIVLEWLRLGSTRFQAVRHILTSIALARTSFKSESRPTSTLLPFSSEVYQDLRNCFRALEGVNVSILEL